MIRSLMLISLFLNTNFFFAQSSQSLDTIYANEKMNTALIFPSEIRQGISGASNFVFTHNREQGQRLGLLKATKGANSNLLVITTDGKVYSFILKYSTQLKELNRFVLATESIGNEKEGRTKAKGKLNWIPSLFAVETMDSDSISNNHTKYSKEFLEKSCASLLKRPEKKSIKQSKDGMSLAIKNIVYYDDLVFMQFEIKNDSGIDFEIDYLKLVILTGNTKRQSSLQTNTLVPKYIYKIPKKTRYAETSRFVYVLPKFTFGAKERIQVYLKELNGNRELVLSSSL